MYGGKGGFESEEQLKSMKVAASCCEGAFMEKRSVHYRKQIMKEDYLEILVHHLKKSHHKAPNWIPQKKKIVDWIEKACPSNKYPKTWASCTRSVWGNCRKFWQCICRSLFYGYPKHLISVQAMAHKNIKKYINFWPNKIWLNKC